MALEVIILAAGQGTRMRSNLPKVLHKVGGRPMLARVIDTALALAPSRIHVVVGVGAEQVTSKISGLYQGNETPISFATQEQQHGTGHAVLQAVDQAEPRIDDESRCLILNGDAPLLDLVSLRKLMDTAQQSGSALGILTARPDDPTGLGRILRDGNNNVTGIVEQKDATGAQQEIGEINSGIMVCQANSLKRWLGSLGNSNSQGEYYLTDIVGLAVADGLVVSGILAAAPGLLVGVNSRLELAQAERVLQRQIADKLLLDGVTLADPCRVDVRGRLVCGTDCEIDINVVFEGEVVLGNNVRIEPNCVISSTRIGNDCTIKANSMIEDSTLGKGCQVGPFARVRPDTTLGDGVRIGNFVELKKAAFGADSKANHLAYVGDSTVGSNVNIGAGVITCNYDGANKHHTVIGDDVFVGSDSQLVSPVHIGSGATIGAGTTVTRDVAADTLAITRSPYKAISDWKRPEKKRSVRKEQSNRERS